jgi:HSP20 family protein
MPITTATDQPFNQMARQMNKLLDQMNKGYYSFAPSETWTPSVNLYENDTVYLVCVDLAGVDKEKIDVVVADQRLKLRGQRAVPTRPDGGIADPRAGRLRVHLMEIDHGAFSREVELPRDVARERIIAVYRDGMLWIELPKK